jgi:hypothetical protein
MLFCESNFWNQGSIGLRDVYKLAARRPSNEGFVAERYVCINHGTTAKHLEYELFELGRG